MNPKQLPKVTQMGDGTVYVSFIQNGKRKRIFNGTKYGIDISPNNFPINQRIKVAQHLSYALYNKLESEGELRRLLSYLKMDKPSTLFATLEPLISFKGQGQ